MAFMMISQLHKIYSSIAPLIFSTQVYMQEQCAGKLLGLPRKGDGEKLQCKHPRQQHHNNVLVPRTLPELTVVTRNIFIAEYLVAEIFSSFFVVGLHICPQFRGVIERHLQQKQKQNPGYSSYKTTCGEFVQPFHSQTKNCTLLRSCA